MQNEYVNSTINFAFRVKPLNDTEKKYIHDGYTEENKNELLKVAKKKKVLPVVAKLLIGMHIDELEWEKHYNFFFNRNCNVIKEVDAVFCHLAKHGITRIAAYENFGALLLSNTDLALYSSGDVDLYADLSYRDQIIVAMQELGYKVTDDSSHRRMLMTEFLKDGAIIRVNIDWRILRRHSLPISISTDEVVNWNETVKYRNTSIRILPKDSLLYLCLLRIAVHGYSRSPDVRLYIDVQNVVECAPDWKRASRWAKRDGVLTKFITVAYIANHLNGVNVPQDILMLVEQDKYAKRIIKLVYDQDNRTLRYDPTGYQLLKVEAASDQKSVFGEILTMLFPPKAWLAETYVENNQPNKMYWNYYKRFIKQ